MKLTLLFGSYREPSNGARILPYLEAQAKDAGFDEIAIVSAKDVGLPMLEKMYKEHEKGAVPENMEQLAETIRSSDAFAVISGEYNHSPQPGLTNMMDHYLEEWFQRPAGIVGYSAGRFAGMRSAMHLRAYLGELGLVSIPTILGIGPVQSSLSENGEPEGDSAAALNKATRRFLKELFWYADALRTKRLASG